ncbi:hypothetical protein V6N13_053817 [Hibiscus sabdariffa]
MCIERDAINGVSREEEALRRQINFSELMGGEPNVLPVESIEVIEKEDRRGTVDLKGTNENIGEVALPQKVLNGELGLDPATLGGPGTGSPFPKTGPKFNSKEGELALGSKEAVGLAVHEVGRNFESPLAGILSWADRVKLNVGPLDLRLNHVEGNNDDSDGNFSVDCEVIKGRKRKGKARMFGSLLEIRNKSISDNERRRRDKALKKKNWSKDYLEDTELSGKSLSDTDISKRVSMILKEAKKVLNLGKKIGVNFVGNEEDVINDLVHIELKDC